MACCLKRTEEKTRRLFMVCESFFIFCFIKFNCVTYYNIK